MFYRPIKLTGFTCSRYRTRACERGAASVTWAAARARTLLQRLHGGGGLQRDQALPLQVENVLLLELLHLDELLLEGQLLAAELLAEGRRTETQTDRQTRGR